METIRNYLEAMFAQLPDTAEVRQAKDEMLQMMEDRYHGLIDGGMKENEAVGTLITEFGDIDELRESLSEGEGEHSTAERKAAGDERKQSTVQPDSRENSHSSQRTPESCQDRPYREEKSEERKMIYPNPACEIFMEFYWETIVCLYLIWSFLTFDWWVTWIIWPVAAVVHGVMEKSLKLYAERKEEEAETR